VGEGDVFIWGTSLGEDFGRKEWKNELLFVDNIIK